ncbi:MAG: YjbQ family protein [Deltaproteobacteria bacterium]|nr:YjbQ family protein [Deltaproteobacteria bacterium]
MILRVNPVHRLKVETESQMEMIDVTAGIRRVVKDSGIMRGMCHVFVPHTTAAITINENADPNVRKDMIRELLKTIPTRDDDLPVERNASAHTLSTLVGASQSVIVENGKLVLGTWQAVYLCEFDGPRSRTVLMRIMAE